MWLEQSISPSSATFNFFIRPFLNIRPRITMMLKKNKYCLQSAIKSNSYFL